MSTLADCYFLPVTYRVLSYRNHFCCAEGVTKKRFLWPPDPRGKNRLESLRPIAAYDLEVALQSLPFGSFDRAFMKYLPKLFFAEFFQVFQFGVKQLVTRFK